METENRLQDLISKLKQHGMRLTPQRFAVLKALATNTTHPTADQVYQQVRQEFPMTSLATIYKTVALLKEIGQIQELSFDSQGSHFDGSSSDPHPHLICVRCKAIADAAIPSIHEIAQDVAATSGYRLVTHRLDFFGICPRCQETNP